MTNHFKTSLDKFLLYPLFIEIVIWTDLIMSLSREASMSTLLTGPCVSLVKKTDQYNQLKGNSYDFEGNQY